MSLIGDALKRQQEDGVPNTIQTPEPAPAAPAPPTPPTPPAPTNHKPPRKSAWGALVGILLIIVLLGGAGTWMLIMAFQYWQNMQKQSAPTAVSDATATSPATTRITPPPEVAVVEEPASAPPVEAPTPQVAVPAPEPKPIPEPEPAPPPRQVVTQAPMPEAQPEQKKPAEIKEPIVWPSFKLKGVVGNNLQGSAFIDKHVLAVGEGRNGITVISIGKHGAWLEHKGEKKFFKVGYSE